ncbi:MULTISPECIES: hypothetical protein [unclassified Bradyrhizobium]|uniref:hypothetical protein n=1 Tax=unclassified Bradyrhizobium TaxID=2631580 RepID=UPI0020B2C269|nr:MULTISPECIES: hypothetical protein [unclassified Bradyrhizobium]MCP3380724.1 hypothetical protein [Bradyrhizobium sp. CCGUVB4N]MCP3441597.1 hypothetical protein [Bradyrhizobium sp. CCGUVB14]WFU79764.1 hypothetical protein QA645_35560 [Bradyrhizobium sp. CIAT3101]
MIKLHLDSLALAAQDYSRVLIWTIIFNRGSAIMGFIKFTKGTSLSDKDRKALQKLLTAERKKLQSALKDVDASLATLGGAKKSKKKK